MNKQKGTWIVAALLMGTSMGAMANETWPSEVRIEQQTVRFDDLDLGTRAGVATLHQRLRVAASNVCEQGTASMPIRPSSNAASRRWNRR